MAGLPSGSNPSYVTLGDFGVFGAGLAALETWTQEFVQDFYKIALQGSAAWGQASAILYQTLDSGLAFTVSLVKAIAETLLGSIIGASTVDEIFDLMGSWSLNLSTLVSSALSQILALITGVLGTGGSGFPWNFPMGFGDVTNDISNLAATIAAIPKEIQQLRDAIVQQLTGTLDTGHSLDALKTALQQTPGKHIVGELNGAAKLAGGTIGELFNEGQVVAAKIAGELNTDITIAGNAVHTLVDEAGLVAARVAGDLNTDVKIAGQAAGDVASKAVGIVDAIVQTAMADATLVGQSVEAAAGQLVELFSSAPQQLQGFFGTFGIGGFIAALGAHKANTTATQQQVISVAAALNTVATPTGTDVTVDFTAMNDQADMSGVMSPGTGAMGVINGQAVLTASNTSDIQVFPTQAGSDYIVLEITLGSLADLASSTVITDGIFRSNSTLDTYTVIEILYFAGRMQVWLGAIVSGAQHLIGAVAVPNVAEDGVLKIIVGDRIAGNPHVFEVIYNNTVVMPPTIDSSLYSQIGATQRYVGLLEASYAVGKFPPGIKKVRYYDNAPGAGARPFAGLPANNSETPGGTYPCSDTGLWLKDNGSTWDRVMGGPLTVFTESPTSGWSQPEPMGTATVGPDLDARMITAPSVSGDHWRLDMQTLTPAAGYAAEVYLETSYVPAGIVRSAMLLRDSSTGKFVAFGIDYDTTNGLRLRFSKWNDPTSFNSDYATASITSIGGIPNWFRLRDDGAYRYAEYTFNGTDWTPLGSAVVRTDFITPDEVGRGVSNAGSGEPVLQRLRSYEIN